MLKTHTAETMQPTNRHQPPCFFIYLRERDAKHFNMADSNMYDNFLFFIAFLFQNWQQMALILIDGMDGVLLENRI